MSAYLPDGSVVAIATAYGTAKPVTAVSNASPAVATAAAHGLANGTIIEAKSGWSRLNDRVMRVDGQTTGTFEYSGLDSTSAQFYPSGSGAGSVREITAWTQIAQILSFETSGGEQQFAPFSFLENDFETQLPTITSAQSIKIGIADDPTLMGYLAIKAAAETRSNRALRLTLPNGGTLYYNGIVSFNPTPSLTKGQVMSVTATFSLQSAVTRY